jgi:hypothetical protein
MTFFHGTPEGKGSHDDLAQKIGLAGKNWARDHWRKQDMAAYMCMFSLVSHDGFGARPDELRACTHPQSDSSSNGLASLTAA